MDGLLEYVGVEGNGVHGVSGDVDDFIDISVEEVNTDEQESSGVIFHAFGVIPIDIIVPYGS